MSDVQAFVFRRTGAMLAEISPDLRSIKWALNRPGKVEFSMPYTDPKCTRDILAVGNWLLFQFESGLEEWGGVIDLPLGRRKFEVDVTGWSGERLLDVRVSGKDVHFNAMAPGAIFQRTIELENADYATGIGVGNIYAGGSGLTMRYHYYDLLRRAQELARLTGEDFAITTRLVSGQLSFLGNWYQRRGRDVSGAVGFEEDQNVVDSPEPRYDEQGPIANVVYTIGDGVDWGDSRPVGFATDTESVERYGYREYSEQQAGVVEPETLNANAAAILETMKQPRTMMSLTVADESPGRFADYGVGDIVNATLFVRGGDEWAFDGKVRVVARQLRPDGLCDLEVAEWTE